MLYTRSLLKNFARDTYDFLVIRCVFHGIFMFSTNALFPMKQLSIEQRTVTVKHYLKSGSVTQRQFRSHFKVREAPTVKTIQRLTEKFLSEGSIRNLNTGRSGRKKESRRQDNVEKVAKRVSETPKVSVRRLSSQVGLSRSSTHRILKQDLSFTAYKLTVSQPLSNADFHQKSRILQVVFAKVYRRPKLSGQYLVV